MRISRLLIVFSQLFLFAGALLCLAVGASAQQTKHKVLHLLSESPVRMENAPTGFLGAPQCDDNGALFVRLRHDGTADPMRAPVRSITPSGNPGPSFSLADVPGFDLSVSANSTAFAVSAAGGVDFLAQKKGVNGSSELYVIRFTAGGHYLSMLKLGHYFPPHAFAVLPGGGYFVLGTVRDVWNTTESGNSAPNVTLRPVGVFFGPKGKLLWEINMQDTLPPASSSGSAGSGTQALREGMVAAGPAGDVYVKRVKPANSFYVIRKGGAQVSTITVTPPFAKAVIASIVPVVPDRLAVQFEYADSASASNNGGAVFSIISAKSGLRIVDYQASPETTGMLGCYTQTGFELLARQPGGGLSVRFVSGNQKKKEPQKKEQQAE